MDGAGGEAGSVDDGRQRRVLDSPLVEGAIDGTLNDVANQFVGHRRLLRKE
jgi:hypothetical protein